MSWLRLSCLSMAVMEQLTSNAIMGLGVGVISRQQEALRIRDRRHGTRVSDSPAFSSCDMLVCSIHLGRTGGIGGAGLPVRTIPPPVWKAGGSEFGQDLSKTTEATQESEGRLCL